MRPSALPHREIPSRTLILGENDLDPALSGNYEFRVDEEAPFELSGRSLLECDEETRGTLQTCYVSTRWSLTGVLTSPSLVA